MPMTSFSLGSVWEETIAFLRREWGLLFPVAVAIFAPAQLLIGQAMPAIAEAGASASPTMPAEILLLGPAMLLTLFGHMVLALLATVPGISVGEALAGAIRRFGAALVAIFVAMSVAFAAALAVMVAATLGVMIFQSGVPSANLAAQIATLFIIPFAVVWVRLLMLPAVAACEGQGAAMTLRRAWMLSRDNVMRLVAIWLVMILLGTLLAFIDRMVIGSLFELIKLGTGIEAVPEALRLIVSLGLEATLSLGFSVYVALVYRRLAAG
ncbi:hypothetical protein [Rhizorhabdus sp.]|uniref:hypothetical protein n=2 Tax=Rhizorhabdus sp. TaxID=1968843 RepID=UPI0035B233BA